MSRHAPRDIRPSRQSTGRLRGSALKDSFRLEQRRETRHAADGSLRASYTCGGRFGITHLDLIDRSPSGMGATSRTMIERGATIMICPEGSTIPWLSARVVRCEERDGEFVVGMRYTGAAKAA